MHVNLDGVEAGGDFQPLPSGDYAAKLTTWEEKISEKGNPCVHAVFEIVNSNFTGRTLLGFFPLMESCFWKLKQFSLAVDFPATDDETGFDTDDLFKFAEGNVILLSISQEKYISNKTGKEHIRNKIEGYKPVEDEMRNLGMNPPPPDDDVPFA